MDQISAVTRADIEAAHERLAGRIRRTPTVVLEEGAFGAGGVVALKLELVQHTGTFKPRGAFNRILSTEAPDAGIIAASGGNHGLAVAYAARSLGLHAEVFVPEVASTVKVDRIRRLGAEVVVTGAFYPDALIASEARAQETGALVVHAYDQPEVVAGQGTVGKELEEQLPDLDTVLVAVGGGGLIGGVSTWFGGTTKVVAVEPLLCPTMHQALAAGEPVTVDVGGIAADSLGAGRLGDIAFAAARRYVDRVVLVDDEAIERARTALWRECRILAEPGGAAALAGLLSRGYEAAPGERVGVLICGGNTSTLPA